MIGKPIITVDCTGSNCGSPAQIEFELEKTFNGVHWSDANLSDFLVSQGWHENKDGLWLCPSCKEKS